MGDWLIDEGLLREFCHISKTRGRITYAERERTRIRTKRRVVIGILDALICISILLQLSIRSGGARQG